MKRFLILNFSLLFCLVFAGCGNNRQDLPNNPIVFNETEIDWNWAIENDWKYYLAYSTIKPKWVIWDFNYAFWECLWYVGDDKNDRIYELNGESADEWLIKYYANGEMEMPMILREISISNESYIPESVEEPEEDIPEWWWERITVVTDMCEEEWWELDYWNWAEICVFWEDNRCYFDDLAYWNCRNGNIPEENEENNQFLEDIKSGWEQPQRINDYPKETEKVNVLDITEKTMDAEYLINLKVWDKTFDVVLENNSATRALYEKIKEWNVVVNAKEYWWFEKVWNLGFSLPREDKQITTQLWDLVLYNWNQVSLFYNSNSWSYTKLWKVQNITESDFWDWDITLTFSLKK